MMRKYDIKPPDATWVCLFIIIAWALLFMNGCASPKPFNMPHVFIQEPFPVIGTNCRQTCEKLEKVTMEKYIKRYNEVAKGKI